MTLKRLGQPPLSEKMYDLPANGIHINPYNLPPGVQAASGRACTRIWCVTSYSRNAINSSPTRMQSILRYDYYSKNIAMLLQQVDCAFIDVA
jgi:hypothetical protein